MDIKTLGLNYVNTNNTQTIVDYDIEGGLDRRGNLKKLYGKEALNNAIVLWLNSQKGDFYGELNKGGKIIKYLSKGLSDDVKEQLETSIREGLEEDFSVTLIIDYLNLEPDYVKRRWVLTLELTAPTLLLTTKISTSMEIT